MFITPNTSLNGSLFRTFFKHELCFLCGPTFNDYTVHLAQSTFHDKRTCTGLAKSVILDVIWHKGLDGYHSILSNQTEISFRSASDHLLYSDWGLLTLMFFIPIDRSVRLLTD